MNAVGVKLGNGWYAHEQGDNGEHKFPFFSCTNLVSEFQVQLVLFSHCLLRFKMVTTCRFSVI